MTAQYVSLLKSFLGYLEGSRKSAQTIQSYRLDVESFYHFLRESYGGEIPPLKQLSFEDLERYRAHLLAKGLKVNTRRRKLLTISQCLNFLAQRKKIPQELARKIPSPHKVEKRPWTVSSDQLIEAICKLPFPSLLEARNRALLWVLAETGCLVSELSKIRYEHWKKKKEQKQGQSQGGCFLEVFGSLSRTVPVSGKLYEAVMDLKKRSKNKDFIFFGFNRFGPLSTPITPRGVELLVKAYAERLGDAQLTPRTFRHSITLKWFAEGVLQTEVQNRLGLKTTYAFRSYLVAEAGHDPATFAL